MATESSGAGQRSGAALLLQEQKQCSQGENVTAKGSTAAVGSWLLPA